MSLVLDAGAFIAVERSDRSVVALLKAEAQARRVPVTHGGVVAQVWRDGARQPMLAALLSGVEIVALDDSLGRQAGALLARSGGRDVIDAALAVLATDEDVILTSDPEDLRLLSVVRGAHVDLVAV